MENSCQCCGVLTTRQVVVCSGASNLGQIANRLAVEMQKQGRAQMTCLAAIAAGLSSYIKSLEKVDEVVVIDGCSAACAKKIIENTGHTRYTYYDMSNYLPELDKEKRYDQVEEEVKRIWKQVIDRL